MAIGILSAAPEFTKQVYDDVTEKMFGHPAPIREDEAPEGLIVHTAGQGEQGYYVYDVWESREAFERFMDEKLGPALAEVTRGPPPEPGAPQHCPIAVLVMPRGARTAVAPGLSLGYGRADLFADRFAGRLRRGSRWQIRLVPAGRRSAHVHQRSLPAVRHLPPRTPDVRGAGLLG